MPRFELAPLHLDQAQRQSRLSDHTKKLVTESAAAIALSHGVKPEEVDDRPLYVTLLVDNSGSMLQRKDPRGRWEAVSAHDPDSNAATVMRCQRDTIHGLLRSPNSESIYLSTQAFNSPDGDPTHRVVHPYTPLALAVRLNAENFGFGGATPLYNRFVEVLSAAFAETQLALHDEDLKRPRTATLVISDGKHEYSYHESRTAQDCATIAADLLGDPNKRHIIAAIGIEHIGVDFREVFREMGIPDQWILTAAATPQEIARAINRFTQAASQAAGASQKEFLMLTDSGFRAITPSK